MVLPKGKLKLNDTTVMTTADLVGVYRARVSTFGLSAHTMFYRDSEQHMTKLAQLATLLRDYVAETHSLLDIGCGYGSLVPLLPPCDYKGIDVVGDFINAARERYANVSFEQVDLAAYPTRHDWCVLAGVVNSSPSPDTLISSAWALCTRGLVVDFIDSRKVTPATSFGDDNSLFSFDIGDCVDSLLDLGAQSIQVISTTHLWTFVVATRPSNWLRWR
jgi:SAM-dependent methyltransferase